MHTHPILIHTHPYNAHNLMHTPVPMLHTHPTHILPSHPRYSRIPPPPAPQPPRALIHTRVCTHHHHTPKGSVEGIRRRSRMSRCLVSLLVINANSGAGVPLDSYITASAGLQSSPFTQVLLLGEFYMY